jgi:hypothetical protein
LIGNKSDLNEQRRVPYEAGKKLAEEWNATFLETSAKTDNVNREKNAFGFNFRIFIKIFLLDFFKNVENVFISLLHEIDRPYDENTNPLPGSDPTSPVTKVDAATAQKTVSTNPLSRFFGGLFNKKK